MFYFARFGIYQKTETEEEKLMSCLVEADSLDEAIEKLEALARSIGEKGLVKTPASVMLDCFVEIGDLADTGLILEQSDIFVDDEGLGMSTKPLPLATSGAQSFSLSFQHEENCKHMKDESSCCCCCGTGALTSFVEL